GQAMIVQSGVDNQSRNADGFFIRRFRAIQWTRDCPAANDCSGATSFEEEALVELRSAMHPERTFTIHPRTAALTLHWSARPGSPYRIPVTQIASPRCSDGFSIDVDAVTQPRSDGSYAPGIDIAFRITLRDGAGKRLHALGALPSYDEVISGRDDAGIQY